MANAKYTINFEEIVNELLMLKRFLYKQKANSNLFFN